MITFLKPLIVAMALLITGCGGKYSNIKSSSSAYQSDVVSQSVYTPYSDVTPPRVAKRIITKRANITVEVDSLDKAKEELEGLIEKSGGHITNARLYENGYHASVKVPSTLLSSTLDTIANLGDKISQSMSQSDVTNQFVDNEARLKNLILFRDKMKNLLSRTTNIEEIVKIERELRRVQTEIDSLQGQLKYLKDAVALSPIDVNFKEKTVYGPLGYIANGIWWVTKKLFIIK